MTTGGPPKHEPEYLKYRPEFAAGPAAEDALITKMIADLLKNNQYQYAKSVKNTKLWRNGKAHAIRDAHSKSCGILQGELTVHADIPPNLRQGMFAEPGRTYPLIARISTTSGAIRSDQVRGVRGLGIKVLGVTGESGVRAHEAFDDSNQDFVFVTEPAFLFMDAEHYAGAGMTTAKTLARIPDAGMIAVNTLLRTVRRVVKLTGRDLPRTVGVFADPNYHVLGQPFYTAAPIRFGKYVAKLSVAPSSKSVTDLTGQTISPHGADALTDAVVAFFAGNTAEYVVSAQLCTNVDDMPLEDATVEWSTDASPYVPIATISYPRQTAYSPALQNFGDDALTFNSWRAIDEHRPLGSINRLKLRVYEASSEFRHNTNNVERIEPTDLADFPHSDV
jgi:hypothetical protein